MTPAMTLSDVAAYFRVSVHTVRRWIREGRIAPLVMPGRQLIEPEEFERFKDARRVNA